MRRHIQAQVGWVVLPELLLVLKSAEGQFVCLLGFEVLFASAVPFSVVGVGVLGVALVAVVGWQGVIVWGLGLRLGLLAVNMRVLLCS